MSDQTTEPPARTNDTPGGDEEPRVAAAAEPVESASLQKSAEERKDLLDVALSRFGAQGLRIENRSDFQATIAKGHRTNHVLHLILSLVTLGLWLIVWALLAIFGGEKRRLVNVDPYGNTTDSKV
jgi:hypothetical protein